MKPVLLAYCLSFYAMASIYLMSAGRGRAFGDAFFMMAAFSFFKGTAIIFEYLSHLGPVAESLTDMFTVIANVFLFQSALDFLIYKMPTRFKFRPVPVFIFTGYLALYVFNFVNVQDIGKIASSGFGYNSAVLMSIAMFNLYFIHGRKSRGLVFSGVGFIFYCVFEGTFLINAFKTNIIIAKALAAFVLAASSYFVATMSEERKTAEKIGYV